MSQSVRCIRMNHVNAVVEDFDAAVAHMKKVYDADYIMDMPLPEWHACLIETGRVIFEFFSPAQFLLNSRYGPHYVGVEFQVESMEVARAVVAERKIRIARDIKWAIHTDPRDSYGVSFEFWDGYFHDKDWPLLDNRKLRPASYWRDEHPLGLTGYKGLSIAVEDAAEASKFFQGFVGATPTGDEARQAIGGHATMLTLADGSLELLEPTGKGILNSHLLRHSQGIRATIMGVRDIDQAKRYFADRGVPTVAGDRPGSIAVPADANEGMMFEFVEG